MKCSQMGLFLCVCGLSLVWGSSSLATNGMNMIAYDAVSGGMAGADAAAESGVTALAGNPANLVSTDDQEIAFDLSLLMPVLHFENSTMMESNAVDGKKQLFPLPFFGYARHVRDTSWFWGIGLFAQGGRGVDFKKFQSGFGTEDSIYSNIAYGKIMIFSLRPPFMIQHQE